MLVQFVLITSLLILTNGEAHGVDQTTDWNQRLLYGDRANLTCTDAKFSPSDLADARYHWVLPSGDVIDENTLLLGTRYTFLANGSNMLIEGIDKTDFGVYYCIVVKGWTPEVHAAVKLGINVDGAYFGDLRAKYTPNLKTGAMAGVAVLVFMSMLCYNYTQFEMRNDKPAARQPVSESRLTVFSLPQHFPGASGAAHAKAAFQEDNNNIMPVYRQHDGDTEMSAPHHARQRPLDKVAQVHDVACGDDSSDVSGKKETDRPRGLENEAYVADEPTTRF